MLSYNHGIYHDCLLLLLLALELLFTRISFLYVDGVARLSFEKGLMKGHVFIDNLVTD